MAKIHRTITAGPLVIEAVYPQVSRWDSRSVRAGKHQQSSEAQRRMNMKYAYQKLELLIAANFRTGDIWATFTYDDDHLPQSRRQAIRKMNSFLTRLRAKRKLKAVEVVCIYNTEHKTDTGDRLHHHVLLNDVGEQYGDIQKVWHQGFIKFTEGGVKFDRDHTYEAIARYLTKEERDKVGDRLWCGTRNLKRPVRECHRVPNDTPLAPPEQSDVLDDTGDTRTVFGHYRYIKYVLHNQWGSWDMPKPKAKRKPKAKPKAKPKRRTKQTK